MVLKCDVCDNKIKGGYWESMVGDVIICEDCGLNEITWHDDIEHFIYGDGDREFFTDDELSDLEIFTWKEGDFFFPETFEETEDGEL